MNHPQANAFFTASLFASNGMETRGENPISSLEPKPQEQGVLKSFAPRSMVGFVGGGIRNALKRPRATQNQLTDAQRDNIAQMSWAAISA
ncbi:hypothetical protein SAMN05444149_11625 [Pseudosulfitobacter pseudonitzschiae]|uniref:Uncharacterized protein n=1 Tax=Pseudosulfitobacter pseudonitzschiae TaxID=1402135 RepID=A0A073IVP1_9RHOB|nr:hypothetical protein [Pseudosulfitobacter pseudonitzschiae]KEJ93849.1 hypothetical protein SUH3_12720 [Pseudosulfitobacter pseudonitzschiae]QKS10953.1 hypothetical protein HT745_20340 [Pseudosulfitobacter pseudonitzschiae]SHG28226.1 hypothetical protein SAMN05444149_11625 [Pseudosulfitobacter pseudonitzschiae]